MICAVCGFHRHIVEIKEFPEFIRKEFICLKCGRVIEAQNWDRRYL